MELSRASTCGISPPIGAIRSTPGSSADNASCMRWIAGYNSHHQGGAYEKRNIIHIVDKSGVQIPDRKMIRKMVGSVRVSSWNHQGKIFEAIGEEIPIRWKLLNG
jgi:hypothetical protein